VFRQGQLHFSLQYLILKVMFELFGNMPSLASGASFDPMVFLASSSAAENLISEYEIPFFRLL
jgi:hypothetical protein